jgi:flagellar biosynthesis/type III secretory pathway protein FliH
MLDKCSTSEPLPSPTVIFLETKSDFVRSLLKNISIAGRVAQVVAHLPSKHYTLSSNPQYGRKEGRNEGRKERRKKGRKEGRKEGMKEGRKEGRKGKEQKGKERSKRKKKKKVPWLPTAPWNQ